MTPKDESTFTRIASSFRDSVQALRVFTEQIGRHADEYDRRALEAFGDQFSALLGETSHFTPDGDAPISDERAMGDPAVGGDSSHQTEAEAERRVKDMLADPPRFASFMDAVKSLRKSAPQQGETLRRGAVITLVSHFEALVADLIHAFYARYPQALPAEERSLTLSELRDLGSVEDAEGYLVSLEVDSVLRESLDKQLTYFTKRPKLDIAPLTPFTERLVEIAQRRNLYVHNRGRVNRLYLSKVSPALIQKWKANDGEELRTNDDYLAEALDVFYSAGVALLQTCWRKWDKQGVQEADSALIEAVFDPLLESRYEVVKDIATFASGVPLADDENRRIIVVNLAIALRDTGASEEMERVLRTCDWSATDLRFRLALYALRGEFDALWRAVPRAAAAESITRSQLLEWPLYRNVRERPDFAERLESVSFPAGDEQVGAPRIASAASVSAAQVSDVVGELASSIGRSEE